MTSAAASRSGRGWALASLIIGLAGVGIWFVLRWADRYVLIPIPDWILIGEFLIGGLIGVGCGVVGIRRGHGPIRLLGIVGVVLSLFVTLIGVSLLMFNLFPGRAPLPPGPFA